MFGNVSGLRFGVTLSPQSEVSGPKGLNPHFRAYYSDLWGLVSRAWGF